MPDEPFTADDADDAAKAGGTPPAAEEESGLPLLHRREFLRAFTPGMIGLLTLDDSVKLTE